MTGNPGNYEDVSDCNFSTITQSILYRYTFWLFITRNPLVLLSRNCNKKYNHTLKFGGDVGHDKPYSRVYPYPVPLIFINSMNQAS